MNNFISDIVEEPVLFKQEIKTLHSTVHDVKQKMDVQSAQLQKQMATIEEYKKEIDELAPWIANAESETEISAVKPATIKDIEKHLADVKVISQHIRLSFTIFYCLLINFIFTFCTEFQDRMC